MSINDEYALETNFPNPGEQAEALLEICEGDVREAQSIAATNLRFAGDAKERRYWWCVGALLAKTGTNQHRGNNSWPANSVGTH